MEKQFKKHIESNFTELTQHPILVAVSGGVDSVVLLHLCHAIGLNFGVAHCNFHLREGDSDLDQTFVSELCHQLNIPFFTKEFDTKKYAAEQKVSIQVAARESILPQQAAEAKISLADLFDNAIALALQK